MKSGFFFQFLLLAYFFLSSCASIDSRPENRPSVIGNFPHINANCKIYDLDGKLLRSMNRGLNCIFNSDGSTIIEGSRHITKFDEKMKLIWFIQGTFLHHTLIQSKISGNYLFLDSEFKTAGTKTFRSDVLKIASSDGKVIQSASIDFLFKQFYRHQIKPIDPVPATWYSPNFPQYKDNYENSHINSFYETVKEVDGKKTVVGYIVHCPFNRKTVFIDKSLKKITKIVDMGLHTAHDVQLTDNDNLHFYGNCKSAEEFSYIGRYNLTTNQFAEVYSANQSGVCSFACGSVQILENGQLFVTHGNCVKNPDSSAEPIVEYISPDGKAVSTLKFGAKTVFNSAELIDATEYLKKSSGF